MNSFSARGNNSGIGNYSYLLYSGQLLKERICSSRSRFFPVRLDPYLEAFSSPALKGYNELLPYRCVRRMWCVVRLPQRSKTNCSSIFFYKTTDPIALKFHMEHDLRHSEYSIFDIIILRIQRLEGWFCGVIVLGKLPVPGRLTYLDNSRARAYCASIGAGGGCLDIFSLIYLFSPLPLSGRRPYID